MQPKFLAFQLIRFGDEKGVLHSTRPDGKDRYFSVAELDKVKFSQPLTISEAAGRLGISEVTLRRLEEKGIIKPNRDKDGNRISTIPPMPPATNASGTSSPANQSGWPFYSPS